MAKLIPLAFGILACSAGCSGFTLGPVIERKAVIVQAGTAIEVVETVEVLAWELGANSEDADVFLQPIGGWICMHPDHWAALRREIKRLREQGKRSDGSSDK